ncbi:hypothetical protein EAF04_004233 [Stromatinia cepivora]|nr:hypothetical protein EAF04_004233 [Stromatinia cepivora]
MKLKLKSDGAFWRHNFSGYVPCSNVSVAGYSAPSLDLIWCLRYDLVQAAAYEASPFFKLQSSTLTTIANILVIYWANITAQPIGLNGSEKISIRADTFRCYKQAQDRDDIAFLPTFTKTTAPSTGNVYQKLAVPRDFALALRRLFAPTHAASGDYSRSKTHKYGISQTQSEEMTHSVSVESSATAGIDTSSRSFTDYSGRGTTKTFVVLANKSTMLFSKHVFLEAYCV